MIESGWKVIRFIKPQNTNEGGARLAGWLKVEVLELQPKVLEDYAKCLITFSWLKAPTNALQFKTLC